MIWLWVGFVAFVLVMLGLDLFVLNRDAHVVRVKEAIVWTCVCIALALIFNVAVYSIYSHNWLGIAAKFVEDHAADPGFTPEGGDAVASSRHAIGMKAALEFLTGWLIEYSLSLDNIFVIAVIFAHFKVPAQHQHRVLFWGVLGALIFRGAMILIGVELIQRFEWMMYIFGAFLIFTAIKLLRQDDEPDLEKNIILRWARKAFPVTDSYRESRFFSMENGKRMVTPLLLVLLVVETTDVVFAVDSIPAIFSITRDPFLVFTSNVFAILGLRSLYFALAAMIRKFEYLNYSLAFILAFVGVKMIVEQDAIGWHIHPLISLGTILVALTLGIGVSIASNRRNPAEPPR